MSKSRKNNGKNNNIVPRSQHGTAGSNMVWTNEAVSEADFMVFRDAATNKIVNVVAPNGLQVGLFDPAFPGNLTATGHITGSGEIYAHHNITARLGFTGSLQKLYNGTDYLLGGSNVTVTNNENGSISIAANASATTAEVLTAGSGLSMGGTFNGAAARTMNVDINSESNVTAAAGDFVLIHDVTDGTIKKATVSSVQGAGASIDIAGLSNSLNETQLAVGDLFAVADVDASNETKKMTVQDFSQFLASATNGGISESSGKLAISLNELSAAAVDVSADSIAILDATDSSTKLESISDLVSGVAGTVTNTALAASSGVLSVDITNQGSIASLASGDEVLVYDVDASVLKKATVSDFSIGAAPVGAQYVVLSSDGTLTNESVLAAGNGLDLSGSTFSLDLKSSGGLKIDSTELTVEPADFAGTGLEDDGSDNLRISAAAAGTGLSGGGGSALSVDYGSTSGKAVQGNTSFALTAGYGLSGGISSTAIGGGISLNLDVEPEIFAGTGLSVSSNDMHVYMGAGAGTEITTGSEGNIVITPHVKEYHFSSSAAGMLSTTGSLSVAGALGYNHKTSDIGTDVFMFISGSQGSKGSAARGVTTFGGDVVISGTLHGGSPLRIGTEVIFLSSVEVVGNQTFTGRLTGLAGAGITGSFGIKDAARFGPSENYELGTDVANWISGSISSKDSSTAGVTLIGGDSYVSGSLTAAAGISGSLTQLNDGSSYLIAGTGITINSGSSGAVTIATTGGGGGSGNLGAAEDSDYTDGLFTDFTTSTPVGTAVDRFNEVLKGLAPSAAPALDDIDCDDSGTSAKLSFGNSKSISGYSNSRPSTLSPASSLSDVDINGTYSSTSASNHLRAACFGAITEINGTLNEDISADGSNYNADSFGDGNLGTLKLFVNNNSTAIHTTDLSSFGSGNSLNSNGSGFTLSATTPGHFADGSNFATFQHRQGTYKILAADQRNGWNYARVVHTIGGADRVCNYVEWVNDPTGSGVAMSVSGASLGSLSMTGTKNLSGVKYHTGGTAAYAITIANAYRNVYSTSQITFGGSNVSVSAQNIPSINHSGGEDETKSIALSGVTATINADPILNSSITVTTNVPHPLKSNLSNAGSQSISGILLYNLSDTSSVISEPFRGETYRMKNAAYNAQGDVGGSNVWDSTDSLLSVDGLLVYNQTLVAPNQGANGGNFSGITNGPGSNVNYSSITSGTRTYYRKFTNNSGGSKTNFNLTINGSGTIVANGGTLNSSNIKVFCKMPSNGSSSTGWMDLATSFSSGQTADNAGCLVGTLDSSLNATNQVTFGTQSVGSNEFVIVKIHADGSWTGNISQMNISWL